MINRKIVNKLFSTLFKSRLILVLINTNSLKIIKIIWIILTMKIYNVSLLKLSRLFINMEIFTYKFILLLDFHDVNMCFLFPRQCIMCHCCETMIGQLKFRTINTHYTFGLPLVTSQIIEMYIYKNYSYWLSLHQSWQRNIVLKYNTTPVTLLQEVLPLKGFVVIFQAISLDILTPM